MIRFHFLWLSSIPFCLCVSIAFLYPFIYLWALGLLLYLGYYKQQTMLQWIWGYIYLLELVFSDKNPEVELLDHMVVLFLIFWENSMWLPIAVVSIYINTNSVRVSFSLHPCQHLLFLVFLIVATIGMRWCLIVVLIFIFLMINDIEHLFMCLLSIGMSLEKCLFRSSAHFLNQMVFWWFFFFAIEL